MITIRLDGCRPEPLSSYLKALGVLRIITEQCDQSVRAWWQNGALLLRSTLDAEGIVSFFMSNYSPTPVVAPWNGGSGFYEGDRVDGLLALKDTTEPRFESYRKTIEKIQRFPELPRQAIPATELIEIVKQTIAAKKGKRADDLRVLVEDAENSVKAISTILQNGSIASLDVQKIDELIKSSDKVIQKKLKDSFRAIKNLRTKAKSESRSAGKSQIVQACRNRLDGRVIEWLDAAVVLGEDDRLLCSPILGSGANEGRLDYTNNFMTLISSMLLTKEGQGSSHALIRNSLFGELAENFLEAPSGQHNPGKAGGFNQGAGIENKGIPINPWDFILAIEGSVVWSCGASRLLQKSPTSYSRGALSSPFTVRSKAVGYSSAAQSDQGESRAELWAPLWSNPLGYSELSAFLREGRAEVGRKVAVNGLEFAEAAASLGVDRGVKEFVRFSLLKRRGDSYVALPAGRFPAYYRSESDLIRQLDPVLKRLDGFLRLFPNNEPPARLLSARRAIDEAVFSVLLNGGPFHVKGLVAAIGRMEQILAQRDPTRKPKLPGPLAGLGPGWLLAADDGSLEVRIAAALASIGPTGMVGPLRANLAQINPTQPWAWVTSKAQVSWSGPTLSARMAGALAQRMMDAERLGTDSVPLRSQLLLHESDVSRFIAGECDEALIEDLLYGFTWVRWNLAENSNSPLKVLRMRWSTPVQPQIIPRHWALLKLLFLPRELEYPKGKFNMIHTEASIIPLLLAGRVSEAVNVAQRRLYASGLSPIRADFPDTTDGVQIAAALLLPIHRPDRIARTVLLQ